MADITKDQIIEAIKTMTIIEVNELVTLIEDEFGVSAAAPVAVAAAPGAGDAGGEVAEQTEFDVLLKSAGQKKIQVIKEVRALVGNLGLKEAKELVDSAPKEVMTGVSKEDAEKAKERLEAAGGEVEIK